MRQSNSSQNSSLHCQGRSSNWTRRSKNRKGKISLRVRKVLFLTILLCLRHKDCWLILPAKCLLSLTYSYILNQLSFSFTEVTDMIPDATIATSSWRKYPTLAEVCIAFKAIFASNTFSVKSGLKKSCDLPYPQESTPFSQELMLSSAVNSTILEADWLWS